jgi:hypothetical protein
MEDPWYSLLQSLRAELVRKLNNRHVRATQQHRIIEDAVDTTLDTVYSHIPFEPNDVY